MLNKLGGTAPRASCALGASSSQLLNPRPSSVIFFQGFGVGQYLAVVPPNMRCSVRATASGQLPRPMALSITVHVHTLADRPDLAPDEWTPWCLVVAVEYGGRGSYVA